MMVLDSYFYTHYENVYNIFNKYFCRSPNFSLAYQDKYWTRNQNIFLESIALI